MFISLFLIACISLTVARHSQATPDNPEKLNVLILGDSLALCGFGKRLDTHFRNDPRVQATFTYMACGTNPLSWLKQKPYTSIKAQCGYWSIESNGDEQPAEMQDTYGMTRHAAPKPHHVPKLEDLLGAVNPDVLIIQTGSNLFGLFPDAKTVRPTQHAAQLRNYLLPFKEKAISPPSRLRKIYWVNPPTSGRVAKEVQDFLLQQVEQQLGTVATVIDSRQLVAYPYRHMDPDKEHFLGEEMDQWADKVFGIVQQDLARQPIAQLRPLSEAGEEVRLAQRVDPEPTPARAQPVATATPEPTPARAEAVQQVVAQATPAPTPAPTPPPKKEPLLVKATLVFKSQPIPVKELLPYQESLVAYVYRIDQIVKGHYDEGQILVMHPAHIALKEQKLKYKIGKRYKMRLDRLEGTLWETAKAKDETGQINLLPYIKVDDLKRHPQMAQRR